MSRATAMERIEKLRKQLEEAEAKAQETEAKKAAAEQERKQKKRDTLLTKKARLQVQAKNVAGMLQEVEQKIEELDNPSVEEVEVEADVADAG